MKKIYKKNNKKKKEQLNYMGMDLDSLEELSFCFWCEELIEAGYISKVTRAKSYLLTDGIHNTYSYVKQLKTKSKPISSTQTILQGSSYNPDFHIYWTPKGIEKFCWQIGTNSKCDKLFINDLHFVLNGYTTVEIKPTFDQNGMERLFKNNQKFLYDKYMIFANLVKPQHLFEATFTPEKYHYTAKTKQKRKITFKTRTLKEYLPI